MSRIKELKTDVLGKQGDDRVQAMVDHTVNIIKGRLGYANIIDFLETEKIVTEEGIPFELKYRSFLKDILMDDLEEQVMLKCAQIGMTTVAILKALHFVHERKANVIYTLPSAPDADLLVKTKVDPIVEMNPKLMDWVTDNQTKLKKVGSASLLFLGSFVEKSGIMLSSKLNIHDELDQSNPDTIDIFESRLQGQVDYRGQWFFSNPSYPRYGVHKIWESSNQNHWFIRCGKCGKTQYMSWPESVCLEREIYICKKCKGEITTEDRMNTGVWYPRYESRNGVLHGYWINAMMAPWLTAKDICKAYNRKTRRYFYNFVLGLPYKGSDQTVRKETLLRCLDESAKVKTGIVMGVDQTSVNDKHIVVGPSDGVSDCHVATVWFDREKKKSGAKSVEEFIRHYRPAVCVIDAQPDTRAVVELQELFPFQIFMCFYKTDPKDPEAQKWDETKMKVNTPRDRSLDELIREFTDRQIKLYPTMKDSMLFDTFAQHWEALYLEIKEVNGVVTRRWEHSGDDHFAHATLYWRLAAMRQVFLNPVDVEEVEDLDVEEVKDEPWMSKNSGLEWMNN